MNSPYHAIKSEVANRGVPPDSFLAELIAWGRKASFTIFTERPGFDVYSAVNDELGPWHGLNHRRAVMLEVLRVLSGFESSWNWNEGRDMHNPASDTLPEIEAGAFQVSADSIGFGQDLKQLVESRAGSLRAQDFIVAMKRDHEFAIEYVARLLRHTTRHNGPVARGEINKWLKRDAVAEFEKLVI